MVVGISEFLEKVGKLSKTTEKINALKSQDSPQTRIILQGAYDPNVVWDLPPGVPPYTPNKLVDQQHILIKEINSIYYFIKGFYSNLTPLKKETMFLEFLERLSPEDAIMLCSVKDKKPFKGITLGHIKEAYPGLIPEKKEEEVQPILGI